MTGLDVLARTGDPFDEAVADGEARGARRRDLSTQADTARQSRPPARRAVTGGYLLAGLLVSAYIITLFVRANGQYWPVLDNWAVDAFEIAIALACLARALVARPGRLIALTLGAGLLCWAFGDVAFTIESSNGGSPPVPSVADAFYLTMYPLAYLAIMFLLRSEIRVFQASVWLDGAVAGLGATAICAAFGFDKIVAATGGSPPEVAVNLAYPIGDLILLALVVGAVVMARGWHPRLLLIAAGCALLAAGDTIFLLQSANNTYIVGTPLDATWPTALFVMSVAVWRRPGHITEKGRTGLLTFVLPAVAAGCGLAILVLGSVEHVSNVAVGLAAAALAAAGWRTFLSLRELQRLTEASRIQATTDELTGLSNRRELMARLEASVGRPTAETGRPAVALLLLDLDHFKEINDSFGHPTGDELLQQIGPRIRGVVRDTDTVARLGGDEFAVVVEDADVATASAVAKRLAAAIERPIEIGNANLHVGASIGVALAPRHAASAAELLRCADVAMYRAKKAVFSFNVYDASLDDGLGRMRMIEDLHEAMERDLLTVHYQPMVHVATGEVANVEALVRWPHPNLGLVGPDQFVPLAEQSGLMRRMTEFVLRQAIDQCARWRAQGHDVSVSVNLSASNLLDADLPRRILSLLGRFCLPPDALVLEITETTVMADLVLAKEVIRGLSRAGLTVSIDDFGTGFSSLAYLSDLPVGEMKLDRMFTARLGTGAGRDEAIVSSAIELGHSLGLRVVVEGVENPGIFGFLRVAGCDLAQGYAICMPAPPEELDLIAVAETARAFAAQGSAAIEVPRFAGGYQPAR